MPKAAVAKKKTKPLIKREGVYVTDTRPREFISTGCSVLDCVLGGGWAMGRIANIVGDRSSGKTLMAIEACANFAVSYPKGRIFYREAEAAFDEAYAAELGLPVDRMDFGPDGLDTKWDTVEQIFSDLNTQLKECESDDTPALYIVDSLDALSTQAELAREPGEGTYGMEKPKLMSALFRQLKHEIKASNFCLIVISQIRDKIGVTFGERHTRSGGRALDFYASQIIWLHHMKTNSVQRGGVTRPIGVTIRAKCKKNKVSQPFRECQFDILFGYGVDDTAASLNFLRDVKALDVAAGVMGVDPKDVEEEIMEVDAMPVEERRAGRVKVREAVLAAWKTIEDRFVPQNRKYQ